MMINNLFWYISLLVVPSLCGTTNHPTGHLEPLGAQIPPVGEIFTTDEIPSPKDFFRQFVQPGKPVLFKGAATKMPAYNLWTDEYLSAEYGHLEVDVEEGKKENRSLGLLNMSFREFLNTYNERDVYLVYSLPKVMRDEMMLLKCILCGGYTDSIQDAVMWFSNGGTKSVFHYDAIDNINCLFSGTKDLFMVDKEEKAHVDIDNPEGSFSQVDVDKVDLYKYPGLSDVPWYHGKMEPGDCLFIPYRWFHQVRSYGPRNLAINIWFTHRLKFNSTDCDVSSYKGKDTAPLSNFKVSKNNRPTVKLLIYDEMDEKPVDLEKWLKIWEYLFVHDKEKNKIDGIWKDVVRDIFNSMDTNKDMLVTPKELIDGSISKEHQNILERLLVTNEDEDSVDDDDDEEDEEDGDEDELQQETSEAENKITKKSDDETEFSNELKHDDL